MDLRCPAYAWLERFGETSSTIILLAGPVGGTPGAVLPPWHWVPSQGPYPVRGLSAFVRNFFWKNQRSLSPMRTCDGLCVACQCSAFRSSMTEGALPSVARVHSGARAPASRLGLPFDWVRAMADKSNAVDHHTRMPTKPSTQTSARRHTTLGADDAVGRRARLHRNTRPGALARRGHLRLQPPRHAVPRRQCQCIPCFPAVQCGAEVRARRLCAGSPQESQLRAACAASRWVLALCHAASLLRRYLHTCFVLKGGQDRGRLPTHRPGPSIGVASTPNTCSHGGCPAVRVERAYNYRHGCRLCGCIIGHAAALPRPVLTNGCRHAGRLLSLQKPDVRSVPPADSRRYTSESPRAGAVVPQPGFPVFGAAGPLDRRARRRLRSGTRATRCRWRTLRRAPGQASCAAFAASTTSRISGRQSRPRCARWPRPSRTAGPTTRAFISPVRWAWGSAGCRSSTWPAVTNR